VGGRTVAGRLARASQAGVAVGPGSHGAEHAPGGGAAGVAAHPCRVGPGAGAPVDAPTGHRGAQGVALCHGIVCLAGRADADAGGGVSRPHANALPEWPGVSGARDHEGREWL
jgi:hypothetical protein